ncbi:MAG: hypothetical protein K0Q68_3166 [Moraxellaceae bacterium]|jgi:hypothetical protein|nr:hypothetical protein [Moraxellaceae bacterium]
MDSPEISPEEVRRELRSISAIVPATKEEMLALAERCVSLGERIRASDGLADVMPHLCWHYLADVDIRFKDPEYARSQTAELLLALEKW